MAEVILNSGGVPEILSARSRALRRAGYRVAEAVSEADTVRLALETKPNLIVLGLTSGVDPEICAQLKGDRAGAEIPLIAICSATMGKRRVRHADLCLPATVTTSLLVSLARLLLRVSIAERRLVLADDGCEFPRRKSTRDLKTGQVNLRVDQGPDDIERLTRNSPGLVNLAAEEHDLHSAMCTVIVLSSWIVGEYSDLMDATGREYLALLQKSVQRMKAAMDSACPKIRVAGHS